MYCMDFHNHCRDVLKSSYESHRQLIKNICYELNADDKINEMCDKFLTNDFQKIKKMRDPNKPKKSKTGYMLFCDKHRTELRSKNPDMKISDFSKLMGKMWSDLSDEDKKEFKNSADILREEYNEKMTEYKSN